jgi:hypothetical protein
MRGKGINYDTGFSPGGEGSHEHFDAERGGQLTAAEQQKISPLMLKLADCMRSHGITNFPDPIVNAPGMSVDPHGLDTASAAFHAA